MYRFLDRNFSAILVYMILSFVFSCKDDVLPKPLGELRLEYDNPKYVPLQTNCPFTFDYSDKAVIKAKDSCWYDVKYPKMKAVIYITYYRLQGNLKQQIKQAEKIVYDHTIKASNIKPQLFINKEHKTYGTLFRLSGEAATNFQFYVTDSTRNFLVGSVYFRTVPKPDSLQPAIDYIEKDVKRMIETIQWK